MIIVLNGADFSDKNIGKIAFSATLDSDVVVMLGKVTRFGVDIENDVVQGLNSLYVSLVSAGLWSKLKLLAIPYMASNLGEASFNLVDNTQNNCATCFILNNDNELGLIPNTSITQANAFGLKIPATPTNDISMFGIFKTHGVTNATIINGMTSASSGYVGGKRNYLQRVSNSFRCFENQAGVSIGGNAFGGSTNLPNGAFCLSYHNSDVHYFSKEKPQGISATASVSTQDNITQIFPFAEYFPITDSGTYTAQLIGAGEGLSQAETKQLYELLAQFDNTING